MLIQGVDHNWVAKSQIDELVNKIYSCLEIGNYLILHRAIHFFKFRILFSFYYFIIAALKLPLISTWPTSKQKSK